MINFNVSAKILLDNSKFKKGLEEAKKAGEAFGKATKATMKAAAVGFAGVTTAVAAIAKKSVEAYADYEQLVGGVETLFGAQGQSLEEYAKQQGKTVDQVRAEYDKLQQSQKMVLDNAANAYKTAGLSANEYMETVTSFSASLLQSLDGDTVQAAKLADQAITDMSDNANKMGTSMESIQNAYQGFAKQNYTMLDNLKLGYGGTSQEMYRLLEDASKLDEQFAKTAEYSIDSAGHLTAGYDDIVKAIHIVQDEMGITGTTAKEASTTIQGSLASAKSAWQNLLTGLSDENADIGLLVNNLIETVTTAAGNIIPTVVTALEQIPTALSEIVPKIVDYIPTLITDIVPKLVTAAQDIFQALIKSVPDIVNAVLKVAPELFQAALTLIMALGQGIADNLPELIPTIVKIILEMVTILFENIPMLIEVAKELIVGLTVGIIKALPDLLLTIGGVGATLLKTIKELLNIDTLLNVGKNLIKGLWNGILDVKDWLLSKIRGFVDTITDGIKDFFGIASPSKLFEDQVGKNLALGIGVGFTTNMDEVEKQMEAAIPTEFDVAAGVTTELNSTSPVTDGIDELIAMFKYGTAKTSVENTRDLRRAVNA